jgi:hypothetical protein
VKISDYKISQQTLNLLEENFCLQNLVIPLFRVEETLFVACSNPLDTALLDSLNKMSGYSIEPLIATADSILKALDLYWRLEERGFAIAEFVTKQDSINGLGLWRESERLSLRLPVFVRLSEEPVILSSGRTIEGSACNITKDAAALGLELPLFLPKGLKIELEFSIDQDKAEPSRLEARGVIVHSRMRGKKQYSCGVKFLDISQQSRNQLLKLAA